MTLAKKTFLIESLEGGFYSVSHKTFITGFRFATRIPNEDEANTLAAALAVNRDIPTRVVPIFDGEKALVS
jgi:hypothetical protein